MASPPQVLVVNSDKEIGGGNHYCIICHVSLLGVALLVSNIHLTPLFKLLVRLNKTVITGLTLSLNPPSLDRHFSFREMSEMS